MDDIERRTIREHIHIAVQPLSNDLKEIKNNLDRLTNSSVTGNQLDQLKYQVASLSEAISEMEHRIRQLERYFYLTFLILSSLIVVLITLLLIGLISPN